MKMMIVGISIVMTPMTTTTTTMMMRVVVVEEDGHPSSDGGWIVVDVGWMHLREMRAAFAS